MLLNGVLSNRSQTIQRSKLGICLMAVAGFLLLVALFYMVLAYYGWLLLHFVQPVAALVTAGTVLVIGSIVAFSAYLVLKRIPPEPAPNDEIRELISLISATAADGLNEKVEESPKTALLIAGIAGLIAGKYLS
ncbi:phage holin family protein [Sneathiella sp.]|uniref:phage holin family protein n=1 Tax=Sneathiella sp. TaxID=1964365 RepID=UPI0035693D93